MVTVSVQMENSISLGTRVAGIKNCIFVASEHGETEQQRYSRTCHAGSLWVALGQRTVADNSRKILQTADDVEGSDASSSSDTVEVSQSHYHSP